MKTVCFRAGCLTGPDHSGAQLHGFLAYLVKCAITATPYTVFGYKGKQVRDNLHSADLVAAFWEFFLNPRVGEVYNIGGGRWADCSVLEAIVTTEQAINRPIRWSYADNARTGDHIWWVSDTSKFRTHYPAWRPRHNISDIIQQIASGLSKRLEQSDRSKAS
jgi:CDP-paratose 2-epimerase